MAARVENASPSAERGNVDFEKLLENVDFFVDGEGLRRKDPRLPERCAADHHAVNAIFFNGFARIVDGADVAVSDDRDADARVAFHAADERPVGLAGIHLRARAPVDGEGFDAAVLEAFGQFDDERAVVGAGDGERGVEHGRSVPAEPRFHGYGSSDGTHDSPRDVEQKRHVSQHSRACAFARHFFYGATEIQVDEIGRGLLFDDLRGIGNGNRVATVDLNAYGTFGGVDGELADSGVHFAYEGFGADKFGVNHRRSEAFAESPEADVGYVFHWREQQRGASDGLSLGEAGSDVEALVVCHAVDRFVARRFRASGNCLRRGRGRRLSFRG